METYGELRDRQQRDYNDFSNANALGLTSEEVQNNPVMRAALERAVHPRRASQ